MQPGGSQSGQEGSGRPVWRHGLTRRAVERLLRQQLAADYQALMWETAVSGWVLPSGAAGRFIEVVPRASGLALFDAFASREKTLHANPGRHTDVPAFELESSERFFARHLLGGGASVTGPFV